MSAALYLLRHAHAEAGAGSDHERDLTDVGRATATAVGRAMLARGQRPDRVFVSSAVRTRRTLELVLAAFEDAPSVEIVDELYLAPPRRLRQWAFGEGEASRLVVAHNPGIGELAAELAGPSGRIVSYPPGALTAFAVDEGRARFGGFWPRPE